MNTSNEHPASPSLPPALRRRLVGSTICYPASRHPAFDLDRALQGIQAAGFEQVELFAIRPYCEHVNLDDVSEAAASDLRRHLDRYSLTPAVLSFQADLNTDEGVAHFGRAATFAERLGVRIVSANVQSANSPSTQRAFFDRVPNIIATAKRHGVVLALETHGGLVNTAADGADLVDRVASEHLRIAYDMANVVKYGQTVPERDLLDQLSRVADTIGYVHLKDRADLTDRYSFPPFGDGVMDFPAVLRLLNEGGYGGLMAVEVELDGHPASPEVVDEALVRSVTYLKRIWANDQGDA